MTTKRPDPGKLSNTDEYLEFEASREGDFDRAILLTLRRVRENAANALHYRMRTMSEAFDQAARLLEAGDRGSRPIRAHSHVTDIPQLIAALEVATDAYNAAKLFAGSKPTTAQQIAFSMERTADALDAHLVTLGLKGEHPTASTLRQEAKTMVDEAKAEAKARADQRQAEHDAARAKRIARPLGAVEKRILGHAGHGPIKEPYRKSGMEGKAVKSLVEREMLKAREDGSYELTPKGSSVLTAAARG